MFYQNVLKVRQDIEQSGHAEVLGLRELPGQNDNWVIDIRWRDAAAGEVQVIDSGVLWADLVWRKYPPAEDIVRERDKPSGGDRSAW